MNKALNKRMKYLEQLETYTSVIDDINKLIIDGHYNALHISMPGVQDISFLGQADVIEVFQMTDVEVEDISAIETWEHLIALAINRTKLKDLSSLEKLENIEILDLSENEIEDVNVITKLSKLEVVNLKNNPISEEHIEFLRTELPKCEVIF